MLQLFKSDRAAGAAPVILVITRDASTVEAMQVHAEKDGGGELRLMELNHADAQKQLSSGAHPDVMVVELDNAGERDLAGLHELMAMKPEEVPVVVISPSIDEEMVRLFLRLRVADWLRKPADPHELVQVCRRVVPTHEKPASQTTRCISFTGAHGGAGATTLAVTAAVLLSERRKKDKSSSTCLVDLDFSTGMCGEYLDVEPAMILGDVVPNPDRLDDQLLGVMLAQYSPKLSLLASHAKLGEFSDVDPVIVARFLDLVAARFANIVIDVPRGWTSWSESILLGSQTCYIVTELTVPGLRSARRQVTEIQERLGNDANPKVIVNKNSRQLFKTGISAKEVEQVLGDALAGYIGDETRLVREAIDRGVPVSELKSRNKVSRDLEKILFDDKA